ncbi:MAG: efflux transporter periplasmic adaptor subunit [Alphaproteobacteria bacterium 41-28]|nr:MAG: efflux transporter periplasmic adaptor subunit [Alphaproteobacteria bacterium 41-28]
MKKNFVFIIGTAAIIVGIIIGRYSSHFTMGIEKAERKPLYWIDSMEPQIHYPSPGKSRMGMELVPIYPEETKATESPGAIHISPTVVNNLGVRMVLVHKGTLSRDIETVGYVEPNENKISHINSYAEGWIEKLIAKTLEEPVKKGQLLLQLYSPMLVNAQEEYLIALDSKNQYLIDASYKKLLAFRISDQQIQQLKQTRKANQLVNVYALQDGIISKLNVREGTHVLPETEIMSLVDLSSIWMDAQIYEDQANWVKVGEVAEARLPAFPGKVWKGEVDYVYPQVDPVTRTVKVRFRFDNPEGILKPNMYANIKLLTESKPNVITIPTEALIRTSKGDHVVISLGDGRFDVRPVTIGIESGDQVEILSGLTTGEQVVISGQFLIDSESNLKSSFQRLEAQKGGNASPVNGKSNVIIGHGTIKAIDLRNHRLTIKHDAIKAIDWPAMTMTFTVPEKTDISQLEVGSTINFHLEKNKDNQMVITHIEKAD